MASSWFSFILKRSRLANHRGLTLVELLVAMGVTSVLLMAIVTASLFLQRFIRTWEDKSALAEECSFARSELSRAIGTSRSISIWPDSLRCVSIDGIRTTYSWAQGTLTKNDNSLTRTNLRIDSMSVSSFPLHESGSSHTLLSTEDLRGLYMLRFRISDKRLNSQSVSTLVRNEYEMGKYSTR